MSDLLEQHSWQARERAHQRRVAQLLEPYLRRARTGVAHPVWDFLFTYYNLRPSLLRRWHPGFGVTLGGEDAERFTVRRGYRRSPVGVGVSGEHLARRLDTVGFVAALLRATAGRPRRLDCFGLHEWAMVYRCATPRHASVPLRLGSAGTDAVVEAARLRCTHFDAYRFFTPAAAGRNSAPLRRDSQLAAEQPGCLHAAMDLYRYSYTLLPLLPSELLTDCFALAADARAIDMRASPYDLSGYGFAPIAVETPAGRGEYVRAQTQISERAAPLRDAVATRCEALLAVAARRTEQVTGK